jgi:transcriptional regulator with XRE-family HTH domain
MNTNDYLDAVRVKRDLPSDYAAAKLLGITRQTISGYRNGGKQFDDAIACRVAEVLGIHPGLVMLDMHRERAKTPQERSVWKEVFEGFLTLFPHAKGARIA